MLEINDAVFTQLINHFFLFNLVHKYLNKSINTFANENVNIYS